MNEFKERYPNAPQKTIEHFEAMETILKATQRTHVLEQLERDPMSLLTKEGIKELPFSIPEAHPDHLIFEKKVQRLKEKMNNEQEMTEIMEELRLRARQIENPLDRGQESLFSLDPPSKPPKPTFRKRLTDRFHYWSTYFFDIKKDEDDSIATESMPLLPIPDYSITSFEKEIKNSNCLEVFNHLLKCYYETRHLSGEKSSLECADQVIDFSKCYLKDKKEIHPLWTNLVDTQSVVSKRMSERDPEVLKKWKPEDL